MNSSEKKHNLEMDWEVLSEFVNTGRPRGYYLLVACGNLLAILAGILVGIAVSTSTNASLRDGAAYLGFFVWGLCFYSAVFWSGMKARFYEKYIEELRQRKEFP